MVIRVLVLLAIVALVGPPPVRAQAGLSAKSMYEDALAKEQAVRAAFDDKLEPAALLKAMRTVVVNYEGVVRRFPTSGYSDDALWNAGRLAYEAFRRFSEAADKTTAIRLLRALTTEYSSSKFVREVTALLPSIEASTPRSAAPERPAGPSAAERTAALPEPERTVAPPATEPARPAPVRPAPVAAATPASRRIATLKSIRREVFPESVRVTIELDGEVSYFEDRLSNPDRVFVDLPATIFGGSLKDGTLRFDDDTDPIRQVRLGRQKNRTTRVVLETEGIATYSVYSLYAPFRLVIDCVRVKPAFLTATPVPNVPAHVPIAPLRARGVGSKWSALVSPARPRSTDNLAAYRRLQPRDEAPAEPRQAPPIELRSEPKVAARLEPKAEAPGAGAEVLPATPAAGESAVPPPVAITPPSRNLAGGLSMARQLGLSVSRIVIDPGHGGHDPGARGRSIEEAELVLDVALRLEKLLKGVHGVEVILTRRTDVFVPLEERTALANREAADLFLSIHANANNNTQANGVETYFLNFASNLSAAAVAARENAASGKSMGALPDFVKAIALNNKLDESRDFATHVQRAMISRLRPTNKTVKDLGVKQAPFVVLIGAAMPSVLSEIAFVTNTREAKLLKGSAYRQRVAEALFAGIRDYQGALKPVGKVAVTP
jgi:N-acetylmuramoyl-L-alanine amidase